MLLGYVQDTYSCVNIKMKQIKEYYLAPLCCDIRNDAICKLWWVLGSVTYVIFMKKNKKLFKVVLHVIV